METKKNEILLTIGITTHGNKISEEIIQCLKEQPIHVIISEDKDNMKDKIPKYVKELIDSGVNTKYIYSEKSGIANNRQNILEYIETKYFYIIDNDDRLTGDIKKLNFFLANTDYDVLYIKCYEDGKYMNIPRSLIYMCTWMQIFKTTWFKNLGGYIQSWNFIHEEAATNINLTINLGKSEYKRTILKKSLLSYSYHANEACKVCFDIREVCSFIDSVIHNNKIQNKKLFLKKLEKFLKKYGMYYRKNKENSILISNFINGTFSDVFMHIEKLIERI